MSHETLEFPKKKKILRTWLLLLPEHGYGPGGLPRLEVGADDAGVVPGRRGEANLRREDKRVGIGFDSHGHTGEIAR